LLWVGLVVVLVVVGVVAARKIISSETAQKAKPQNAQPQLSYSAKQAIDVNLVAGAVGQYAAANDALPENLAESNGSLVLCGSTCTSSAYEVGGFNVYQPADIKLIPYAPNLTVPSQSTMYLVPGAKCASDGAIGAVNSAPRSMVILFATVSGTSTAPRCVVL
jgi:hypothetical protein